MTSPRYGPSTTSRSSPRRTTSKLPPLRRRRPEPHPVYLRFGKAPMYQLDREPLSFEIGRARLLRDGRDIAFLATGETVVHALLAAAALEAEGISSRV
jgi:transketolase C-terminal domain/subunit